MPSRSLWTTLKRAANIDSLAQGLTVAAGISLFIMMVMMTIHVVSRKMGMPVPGAFEVSEQLMMVVFAFPLAEISRKKDHIAFELLSDRFSPQLKKRMEMVATAVGLFVFAPLTYKAWALAFEMYTIGEYRQGMVDVPIWPFRVLLAIGLTLFTWQLLTSWMRAPKASATADEALASESRVG